MAKEMTCNRQVSSCWVRPRRHGRYVPQDVAVKSVGVSMQITQVKLDNVGGWSVGGA